MVSYWLAIVTEQLSVQVCKPGVCWIISTHNVFSVNTLMEEDFFKYELHYTMQRGQETSHRFTFLTFGGNWQFPKSVKLTW